MLNHTKLAIICSFISLVLTAKVLDPNSIRNFMYTSEITGLPDLALPTENRKENDKMVEQVYEITMKPTFQQMLPGNYSKTLLYAYSVKTSKGQVASFPGPTIMVHTNVNVTVRWINQIQGKHMLPLDFSEPFIKDQIFQNEVPVVPHLHGMATKATSDGHPNNYWTFTGKKSKQYQTQQPCKPNQAIYKYPNQESGFYWYHDHTYGITRTNVYAGLAGMYIVEDQQQSQAQRKIRQYYGNGEPIEIRYLAIADRSFKPNGQLYYPSEAFSQQFTAWIPQFYGNMMTVNGKVWPKIILKKDKYRLVLLNACNARYINLFFLNYGKKIPFQLIRAETDYFTNPIITSQFLISPGARIQILIDLTQINGEVIMKNNAQAPYPLGDPENLIDQFTGSIMKIITSGKTKNLVSLNHYIPSSNQIFQRPREDLQLNQNVNFPAFPQGEKVYITLNEIQGQDEEVNAMFINGISMQTAASCLGSRFKSGKVYDFYIINLTADTHPIHFHLIDMQKVKSFTFDTERYTNDFYEANGELKKGGYGKMPEVPAPELYKIGPQISPKGNEKVFRDIIDAHPDTVTVIRVSFTLKNGDDFSFDVNGSRYVWHCHMLEHQDNEMMTYFCFE